MKYPYQMMIVGVLALGGVTIGILNLNQPIEVDNSTYRGIETEEVEADCMSVLADEDACTAAEDVLQRKAWEVELNALEASFASTTAVYEEERAAYIEAKTQLEKDLGSY